MRVTRLDVQFRGLCSALCLAVSLYVGAAQSQTLPPATPKAQQAADQKAYAAAHRIDDPLQQLAAFRQFVQEYPKSNRVGRAQTAILHVLLKSFPERIDEIDKQAKLLVKQAEGQGRDYEEADVAEQLAEAGSNGVDLPLAEKLARSTLKDSTEDRYARAEAATYKKYNLPPEKPEEVHKGFAQTRASFLAVAADVHIQQNRIAEAQAEATEAYALDPLVDDVNMVRARLALARGDKAEALADLERAQLTGSLSAPLRKQMVELYREAHGGSDDGLQADLDTQYASLYPAPFPLGTHPTPASGHTVLVELFTGSGCGPCVGGDLAVDGVLQSYPRSAVVALAFDQHIPEPDPLANPDALDRADVYGVHSTPTYLLDGAQLSFGGAGRDGSKELYRELTAVVDQEAASPSQVKLDLTAKYTGDKVQAQAVVTAESETALQAQIVRKVVTAPPPNPSQPLPPKKQSKPAKAAAGSAVAAKPAAPLASHLVLNFALVEDEVRYSGENGIRFHRMVVRSLFKPAGDGFAIEPGATATLDASFDPATISAKWSQYLTTFEQGNDRFSKFEFISTDTSLNPKHLAIAAWVQDAGTHRILQAAFVPVGDAR